MAMSITFSTEFKLTYFLSHLFPIRKQSTQLHVELWKQLEEHRLEQCFSLDWSSQEISISPERCHYDDHHLKLGCDFAILVTVRNAIQQKRRQSFIVESKASNETYLDGRTLDGQ